MCMCVHVRVCECVYVYVGSMPNTQVYSVFENVHVHSHARVCAFCAQETMSSSNGTLWRTAVDPRSGRPYYYHSVTKETTWTKPLEMSSPEERKRREDAHRQKMDFFKAMETNMRTNIANGMLSSDIGTREMYANEPTHPQRYGVCSHVGLYM